ncbi:MAG: hypothetical protein ACLPKT_15105 [Methylocella sp.]
MNLFRLNSEHIRNKQAIVHNVNFRGNRRCSKPSPPRPFIATATAQGKPRQAKASQAKPSQAKARQGKARQGKARQGKASQAKPSLPTPTKPISSIFSGRTRLFSCT